MLTNSQTPNKDFFSCNSSWTSIICNFNDSRQNILREKYILIKDYLMDDITDNICKYIYIYNI